MSIVHCQLSIGRQLDKSRFSLLNGKGRIQAGPASLFYSSGLDQVSVEPDSDGDDLIVEVHGDGVEVGAPAAADLEEGAGDLLGVPAEVLGGAEGGGHLPAGDPQLGAAAPELGVALGFSLYI